ncbi:hypothetical protein H4R21_002333 [Coemansia helicoidea]|uniref:Uncharacterized protein n=1 Tax=Coemansia helicoidea TaxID=1286919 RepID=A0ACC1L7X9_9FUNG|nr:hypothetical protein H4R21_002333 [Coemansia helicoidea]
MAVAYTFFAESDTNEVCVFRCDHDKPPAAWEGRFPDYKTVFGGRSIELRQYEASVDREFITGKFGGLLRRSAIVSGNGVHATIRRCSLFNDAWQFVHNGNTYKWQVTRLGKAWSLQDGVGHEVATFQRRSFWAGKRGVLRIAGKYDRSLGALVILTCEIVNRTVDSSEQAAAAVSVADSD